MVTKSAIRLFVLAAALGLVPAVASAQYTPRTLGDPATGEDYHFEASFGIWSPGTTMSVTSEAKFGIAGSLINFKRDLGLTDQRFKELHAVLRASKRNKLRFAYIPINFEQETILTREIIFQGIRYRVGLPVNSQLNWKALQFGYEFDFISRNRGFAGFMIDMKYTDVHASLQSPIDDESLHVKAPVPTVGGIARFYVVPNVSITGELTGASVPTRLFKDYKGHYIDLDIYATLNFTNNFGAQMGYRSFDLSYDISDNGQTSDAGSFLLKGFYFGGVARF